MHISFKWDVKQLRVKWPLSVIFLNCILLFNLLVKIINQVWYLYCYCTNISLKVNRFKVIKIFIFLNLNNATSASPIGSIVIFIFIQNIRGLHFRDMYNYYPQTEEVISTFSWNSLFTFKMLWYLSNYFQNYKYSSFKMYNIVHKKTKVKNRATN